MKLRSLICLSAAAAAMGAAALDGANTFARLKVSSPYASTIIALPFAGCGESESHIYVTNLVMTANLDVGDTLLWKDGGTWYAWEVDSNHKWAPITTTAVNGTTVAPLPEETAVPCGQACWLNRTTPANDFYLYGQVLASAPSVTVAAGTANAVTYSLVGYPAEAEALDLYVWKPDAAADGDTLLVPADNATGRKEYRYNGTAWTKATITTRDVVNPRTKQTSTVNETTWTPVTDGEVKIPAGRGFMYGRKATTAATLIW